MSPSEDILYGVEGGIALITLNRPDRLNAWTPAMHASVKRAMIAASKDDAVRVIVVTGAGRGFCAGADMAGLQQIQPGKWNERPMARGDDDVAVDPRPGLGPDVRQEYTGRFGYIMSIQKPVIAAINGACAGIGLAFVLYCDMRFASSAAVFTTSFAQRGLVAEHGMSWLLPRIVGTSQALDLLFSARRVKADEAERLGLVSRTFPAESFMDEVRAYAGHLALNVSPRSMAVMKAQVWKGLFQDLNEAVRVGDEEMQKSFGADDFREGVAHFLEKRPARFTGR